MLTSKDMFLWKLYFSKQKFQRKNGIVIHLYMDSAVCLCIQYVAINSFGWSIWGESSFTQIAGKGKDIFITFSGNCGYASLILR